MALTSYKRHREPAVGLGFENILCVSFYVLVYLPLKQTNKQKPSLVHMKGHWQMPGAEPFWLIQKPK